MKRWMYIPVMMLVTTAMLGLLWWAASCHNVRGYSPATLNRVIAATVFWSTLLMPISVGLVLSFTALSKDVKLQWPVFELFVIGFLLLAYLVPDPIGRLYGKILPKEAIAMPVSYVLVVVSIGLSTLNIRVGIRDKKLARTGLSVLTALGGTAILLMWNAWAIYLE